MKPLADPIPPEESRALAERLLAPYLQDAGENASHELTLKVIAAISTFDLERALGLLQQGQFRDEDSLYQIVRRSLASKLAATNPARAEAMVESIRDPLSKVGALNEVARALPASERARKQAVLERATALLKDHAHQATLPSQLQLISEIAEQWLDLGERDQAQTRP